MADLQDRITAALADRYAIQRELGRGGMAVVYLAEDLQHQRRVAVKVFRPELGGALGPERFLREIAIAAQLNHPHIVPLLSSGEADGLLYYVMPFVEGETLRQRLVREGQLPIDDALEITREVATALSYAHSRDVVHRDIKPENILLSTGEAVVADFGIARAITEAGGEPLTATGITIGTPGYMSPEQASGETKLDGRSDVFSLGCVLYEMLAGERPFEGRTRSAIIAKVLSQPAPALTIVRPSVPAGVTRCVERALEKAPADRFQTAGEFADALDHRLVTTPHVRQSRRRGMLVTLLVLVAVTGAWLLRDPIRTLLTRGGDAGDRLDPTRIAVLSIDAPGADSDIQIFAANLAARLSDGLGAIDALTVVSRSGVRPYLEAGTPIDSIARALKVGLLIDGHLESLRDTVRIAVRLIDGHTGDQVAVTHAQAALGERHALMDVVADTVTRLLRQSLGTAVRMRRRLLETPSMAAFEHVQWAESRAGEFGAMLGAGDFAAAQRILGEWDSLLGVAERLDPKWVEPVVQRGKLVQYEIQLAAARRAPDDGTLLRRGLAHAERAIAMAPTDPRARQLRGLLRYSLWANHPPADSAAAARLRDDAEADLRSAVDGNADRASVLRTLSELTARGGRLSEAVHYAEEAYAADPYLENSVPFLLRLFQYNLELDRDEAAARWCHLGAERFAALPMFHHCRLQLMAWSAVERPDPAAAAALEARTLAAYAPAMRDQLEGNVSLLVAAVLARAGQRDSARRIVNRYVAGAQRELGVILPAAGVLALLGDSARALDLIARYVAERPAAREAIRRGPELRPLRAHARFVEIFGSRPAG